MMAVAADRRDRIDPKGAQAVSEQSHPQPPADHAHSHATSALAHHDHDHSHVHDHEHGHRHGNGAFSRLRHGAAHWFTPHSHDAGDKVDSALEASREGMGALWRSLAILGLTAAVQAVIVALSGSVALLGDAIHNAADALTALPLGVAFETTG